MWNMIANLFPTPATDCYNTDILCNCEGCRYPTFHISMHHKCSNCNKIGHGQNECSENKDFYFSSYIISKDKQCKNTKCKQQFGHMTESHQIEFEKEFTLCSLKFDNDMGHLVTYIKTPTKSYDWLKDVNNKDPIYLKINHYADKLYTFL